MNKIKIKDGVPYIVRNNINNLTSCMKFSISIFFLLFFYFSDDRKFDTFDQHSKQLVNFITNQSNFELAMAADVDSDVPGKQTINFTASKPY